MFHPFFKSFFPAENPFLNVKYILKYVNFEH
jgi:hypothetical protein